MELPKFCVELLRQNSRDDDSFQRLMAVFEPLFEKKTIGHLLETSVSETASDTEFKDFLELALGLWCLADTQGQVIKLSTLWEVTLGYSVDELADQHFLDLVHPDDRHHTLEAIDLLATQEPILSFTNRCQCKDGSYRFIEWRAQSQGKIIYAFAVDVTDQKYAQQMVLDSELQLRAIFDNSLDAIFLTIPDGHILAANEAAVRMFGYSEQELIQQGRQAIIDASDPTLRLALEERRKTGRFKGELTFIRRDQTKFIGEVSTVIFKDAQGNDRTSMIIRDATERKRMEEALHESENIYRTLVTSLSEGIVLQSRDGTIQTCNAAAERILGLTREQMEGRTSIDPRWQAIHEDYSPFPGEAHPAMVTLQTGEPISNVVMGVHKPDGSLTWILVNSQPLFQTGEQQPYAVVASFADITQIRQMAQTLQDTAARLQSIFDTIDDAVWSMELPSQSLTYLNPSAYRIFERPLEELQSYAELGPKIVHPDDLIKVRSLFEEIWKRGRMDLQYRIVRPNGEVRWIHNRAWLAYDKNRLPLRIEGIISDITESKLIQQQEIELEIERERVHLLNDFISNTSHELRTPLAIVNTNLYLMTRIEDPLQRKIKATQAQEQLDYLNTLINQLHEMAKLDQLTHLDTDAIRVNEFVEQVIQTFLLRKSSIILISELSWDLPDVQGNLDYLATALAYLLDNATQFSPRGSEVIVQTTLDNNEVVIGVKDKGIGIDSEHLKHIFDHFYKVDQGRTRGDNGPGIGLTFVKRIMALHGGRITVESKLGEGSTFRLHFPVPDSSNDQTLGSRNMNR